MTMQAQGTTAMQARAAALLHEAKTWTRGTRKSDRLAFVLFPSSDGRTAHYTRCDGAGCTCKSFYHRGTCSHSLAVRQEAEQAREAATRRPNYDELFPLTDSF